MASKTSVEQNSIEAELESLKEVSSKCRIMTDMGEFAFIVNAGISETDIIVKIQLTSSYPSIPPTICFRGLDSDKSDSIVYEIIRCWENHKSLVRMFEHAAELVSELQFTEQKPKELPRKVKLQKKTKQTKEGNQKPEKKPPMRTASDVIKRIQWDNELMSEHFIVGYMDRFTGVVEKQFDEFSWVDPAMAEWNELNVPEHRIEYFKYRGTKVWDKKSRTDDVFGSTGGVTISEFTKAFQKELSEADLQTDASAEPTNNLCATESSTIAEVSECTSTEQQSYEIGAQKRRPTHFIAIPVTDGQVLHKADTVLKTLAEKQPNIGKYAIEIYNLHVSLSVLRIDSEKELEDVKKILQQQAKCIPQDAFIKFAKLDQFNQRNLYNTVEVPQSIHELFNNLMTHLKTAGIQTFDRETYTPHMTLVKIPWKEYNEGLLSVLLPKVDDSKLHYQRVSEICIFSMDKDDWGAYKTEFTVFL